MAYYSYKELCYQIPEYINKAFVDEFNREPDGDPGYDGDYWTLAAMYVEDLIKQRDELLEALEAFSNYIHAEQCSTDGPVHYSDGQLTALAIMARKAIYKAKSGAVNHFPDAAKMVPGGLWQLVPVVATKAMWAAWDSAPCNNEDDAVNLEAAYSAMLAAAPKYEGGAA